MSDLLSGVVMRSMAYDELFLPGLVIFSVTICYVFFRETEVTFDFFWTHAMGVFAGEIFRAMLLSERFI